LTVGRMRGELFSVWPRTVLHVNMMKVENDVVGPRLMHRAFKRVFCRGIVKWSQAHSVSERIVYVFESSRFATELADLEIARNGKPRDSHGRVFSSHVKFQTKNAIIKNDFLLKTLSVYQPPCK
jgi:hypothetical protein